MVYTPDPTDVTQPTNSIGAGTADDEFRALKAYIQGWITYGSSTTSLVPGLGNQTFTLAATKTYYNGEFVLAVSAGTPASWMYGQVTGWTSGSTSLTINVQVINNEAAGAKADWVIGPCGIRGITGAQGPDGAQGVQGPIGTAATVAVGSVVTGAAGSSVVITNSGSSSAAVFDFTIPRGDTGVGTGSLGAGTTGNLIKYTDGTASAGGDTGTVISTDGTFAANSDSKVPTEKAVTTYVTAQIAAIPTPSQVDQTARDQIALTNLRLLLNSGVASGALVQGYQWELATDEWGATSTNETYTVGSPNYYSNAVSTYTQVSQGTGTNIGDATSGGGLAAAFDGVTNQSYTAGAQSATATANIGKDYTSPGAKAVARVKVYASNDYGFYNNGGGTTTVYLQYADTSGGSWTTLASATGTDTASTSITVTYSGTPPTKNCWRAQIVAPNAACKVAEVQFFTADAPVDMTLLPPSSVSVSSAPSYMVAYLLWKDDSGSAVLGTDLTVELSRDGGTTYTAATQTNLAAYDGTYSIIKARASVSAQPSGTSMKARIKTLNTKAQRVAAPAIYSE